MSARQGGAGSSRVRPALEALEPVAYDGFESVEGETARLARLHAWTRRNNAFGDRPGVLWFGTPAGTLIEVDVEASQASEQDVSAGTPVSALGCTAAGELVVARRQGDLVVLAVNADCSETGGTGDDDMPQAAVEAFLDATSDVPDGGDLWHTWGHHRRNPHLGARRPGSRRHSICNGPDLATTPGSHQHHVRPGQLRDTSAESAAAAMAKCLLVPPTCSVRR
ncbi:hypothetical protein [Streptomyces sp. NPDC001851]|uniref:hypothetical protein n=1 Tax=Streptomyces sp. NPDC001851 TaxID=3154529 RepID=UPI00332725F0